MGCIRLVLRQAPTVMLVAADQMRQEPGLRGGGLRPLDLSSLGYWLLEELQLRRVLLYCQVCGFLGVVAFGRPNK